MTRVRQLLLLAGLYAVKLYGINGEEDRIYKHGDVMIGALLAIHKENSEGGCRELFLPGINRLEAALYTIEQINHDSEILPNQKLGYDIRDYCMDRAKAMEHTYNFTTSFHLLESNRNIVRDSTSSTCGQCFLSKMNASTPIAAVIGPYGSRNALQVAGLLQVVNIPAISPSATSEELSWSFYKKLLRTVPPDGYQARAMADLIDYFDWKYVAVVAVEHSYGLYGFRALERESFQRKTFCIGLVEYITPTNYQHQLAPIAEKLKRAENIKVIILWIGDTIALDLAKEARRKNLRYRIWIMSDSLATKTPDFLGWDLVLLGVYLGIQPRQFHDIKYESHLRGLTPRSTRNSRNPWLDFLWREEHNCSTQNETKGYMRCPHGLRLTEKTFKKIYDDFIPYQIDATYAVARALDTIYKCKNPLGLLPSGACPQTEPFVSSSDILLYLRNVSFEGLTGRIEFDENGDPLQAAYDIISFQTSDQSDEKLVKVKVGTWDAKDYPFFRINATAIKWYDHVDDTTETSVFVDGASGIPASVCKEPCPPGTWQTETVSCCWQCLECPDGSISSSAGAHNCTKCSFKQTTNDEKTACLDLPVENIHWSSKTAIVLKLLSTGGVLLTAFTMTIFIRHRKSPVVKASNRELSFLLLVDIAAGFTLPLMIISQPSRVVCIIIEPWRYITSSIGVSILLVKTTKLLRAFQVTYVAKWIKNAIASTSGQFTAVLTMNLLEVILAIFWGVFDPPTAKTEVEKGKYVLYICSPYQTPLGRALEGSMLAYLILISVVCTLYAFKARMLPENFSEARYIGFAMYILLLSWVTFFPVQSSLAGWYVAVVSCTTALVSSYGLLACMYAPKIYVILRHPEQNTAQFVRSELRTANKIIPLPENWQDGSTNQSNI